MEQILFPIYFVIRNPYHILWSFLAEIGIIVIYFKSVNTKTISNSVVDKISKGPKIIKYSLVFIFWTLALFIGADMTHIHPGYNIGINALISVALILMGCFLIK